MAQKLSDKLQSALNDVEIEIKKYLRENTFYLEFRRKDYAACEQGQILQHLTIIAINLDYEIKTLRKLGL